MNLTHYEYVRTIADTESLSLAAEQLFITQPALTQVLKKMEQELGGPLFEYKERRMQITALGQIVLETAKKISEVRTDTLNRLKHQALAVNGQLSVAVNIQTGSMLMGKIFAEFHRRYPNIMIHFITSSNNGAKNLLARQAVDIIYYNDFDPFRTDVVQHLLAEEPILLAIDKNTALKYGLPHLDTSSRQFVQDKLPWNQPPVNLAKVSGQPFILSTARSHFRHLTEAYLAKCGISPYIICENANFHAIQNLVAEQVGISLIPSSMACYNNPNLLHFHLEVPFFNRLVLAHRKDYDPPEEARYFISLIKDFCKKNGEESLL